MIHHVDTLYPVGEGTRETSEIRPFNLISANEILFSRQKALSSLLKDLEKRSRKEIRESGCKKKKRCKERGKGASRSPPKCARKTTLAFHLFLFSDGLCFVGVRIKYNKYQEIFLSLSLPLSSSLHLNRVRSVN